MKILDEIKAVYRNGGSQMEDKQQAMMEMALIVLMFATMITTIINAMSQDTMMSVGSMGLCLGFGACYFILDKLKKTNAAIAVFSSLIIVVFTCYFVFGANHGYGCLWVLVFPYAAMVIVGFRYGLWAGSYFMCLFIVFCWTPAKVILQYEYDEIFLLHFPVLYCFAMVTAIWMCMEAQKLGMKRVRTIDDLNEAVREERQRNTEIAMQTIISICHALEARDPYTNEHSLRVATYVKQIVQELGWDEERQHNIYIASLMHDIGKFGVPDEILKKPQYLTEEERVIIMMHPQIGYNIMKDYNAIDNAVEGILYHHERYDGKGYPKQLKGEEIPVYGRIIAVADAFDAMNSNRIYRKAGRKEFIVEQIREGKGTQFDPKYADILLKLIEEGKISFQEEEPQNIIDF